MKELSVRYIVASPEGDIAVDGKRLDYPLEGDPLRTPYRTYFDVITRFLVQGQFGALRGAISERLGTDPGPDSFHEIIVRSEKHGALSHPATVECVLQDERIKFCLHVAVTNTGKASLQKEFDLLKRLRSRFSLPYIPVPYRLSELHSMVFLLEEWFDDYHEFHVTKSENGGQQLKLWEFGRGYRFLPPGQSFEIYRQAAQILTFYYDLNTFQLIYPWHHAAGDFVARFENTESSPSPNPSPQRRGNKTDGYRKGWGDNPSSLLHLHKERMGGVTTPSPLVGEGGGEGDLNNEKIDVKLTTVRGYEPFVGFGADDMTPPALALFYFLLHLSIQMRLDKLDGVGDAVWADDCCVDATVTGFFEGLNKKNDLRKSCGSAQSFLRLLTSFTKEELRKTAIPIAEQFANTRDYRIIQEHLEDHTDKLSLTLQNFP